MIDGIVAETVRPFCQDGVETAVDWLNSKAGVDREESRPTFLLLAKVAEQLDSNNEIDSLVRALRGEYIRPGPGSDIVQNPFVLPTGRNTHAVNPYSIPSQMAFARAERMADALLRRYFDEHGRYPRALALVLWGLDNIKTHGEGVAQALWLLGVRPVRDALNRATEIEVIPLEQLRRPRIDVVITVSGIFRDLFTPTMALLDKAVRRVATLDEPLDMNYCGATSWKRSMRMTRRASRRDACVPRSATFQRRWMRAGSSSMMQSPASFQTRRATMVRMSTSW